MEKDWKKIEVFTNAVQAEIVKQMLEENGIPALLINKQDSSYLFGKIELYVNEAQKQEAIQLIKTVDE